LRCPTPKATFGPYGGRYRAGDVDASVAGTGGRILSARSRTRFQREFEYYLTEFCGRPTPLYFAERLTKELGGAKIYLKREDLLHTGAHKINNAIGQILLAKRMGKTRIIAETGAGQHGVATATVAAMFGIEMRHLHGRGGLRAAGAQRLSHENARRGGRAGEGRPADAEGSHQRSHARLGHQHPHHALHPRHGLWRASVSGDGAEFPARHRRRSARQILEKEKRLPDLLIACVGGGSNAIGLVLSVPRGQIREDGRRGSGRTRHQARAARGAVSRRLARRVAGHAQLHFAGRIRPDPITHSVSAGLDYAAVGPEHAWLRDQKRVEYTYATDDQALAAFMKLARLEGIIPALESAHAVAEVHETRAEDEQGRKLIIVNLSGRGDKDVAQVAAKVEMN
jgi:tryptophan synthase beta chain